jgi:hypothetical protein
MNRRNKSILAIVLVLVLSLSLSVSVLAEAITDGESTTILTDFTLFIPCALDGAGEDVHITGTLHDMYHFTMDDTGGYHLVLLTQPMGVKGVGLTSGDVYQGTGGNIEQFEGNIEELSTFVNNFRIIGPGPGNNFTVHETYHFTINANGEVTAEVANLSADCK